VQTFWFSFLPQDEFGTAFPFFKKKKERKEGREIEIYFLRNYLIVTHLFPPIVLGFCSCSFLNVT
jgi:hypothetical protein